MGELCRKQHTVKRKEYTEIQILGCDVAKNIYYSVGKSRNKQNSLNQRRFLLLCMPFQSLATDTVSMLNNAAEIKW